MKTLKDHALIFDQNCPLCSAYTGAFIKTGMLDGQGREAYNQMSQQTRALLDVKRARNEIALVHRRTGEVIYGIDSLFRILANAFPVFAPLFRFKPFRWFMKKLYAFISYNRKVIIPSDVTNDGCVPDLNVTYRWMYLLFTWLITSLILTAYANKLVGLVPSSSFYREFLICGGQIVFQAICVSLVSDNKRLDYLGNMMTVSFAGGLILLVFMGIAELFNVQEPMLFALAFLATAALMFLEHWRRMRLLHLTWLMSFTWVLYRLLILWMIF